jgi:hypothetical protein
MILVTDSSALSEDKPFMNPGSISFTISFLLHFQLCGLPFTTVNTQGLNWHLILISLRLESKVCIYTKNYQFKLLDICFGKRIFWRWIFHGVWQAVVILFLMFFTIENPHGSHDAHG